jgi:hypothetical protein
MIPDNPISSHPGLLTQGFVCRNQRCLGVGNGEWGIGNGEWGMGNREWGMGNREWGIGNGEWGNWESWGKRVIGAQACRQRTSRPE